MSSGRGLLFGGGAVVLALGAGLWFGRSTTEAASPRPAPASLVVPVVATASVRTAAIPAQPPELAPSRPAPSRALVADLTDADPKIRRAAIREVVDDRTADPELLRVASRDADLEVSVIATEGLGRLHASGRVPVTELTSRAADRGLNPRVRLTAMNALASAPSPEAAALLVDLLATGDPFERAAAAILLAHQDETVAVPALIRALGDADEAVRANVLDSLRSRSRGRDFGTNQGGWQAWWQSTAR